MRNAKYDHALANESSSRLFHLPPRAVKCRFGHGYTWTHGHEVQRGRAITFDPPGLRSKGDYKDKLDQHQQGQGSGSEDEIIPTLDVGALGDTRVMLSKD